MATPGAESWSLTSPSGDYPEARKGAVMVVDSTQERALLIGGQGYYGLLSDVWSLDLSNTSAASWSELATSGSVDPERAFSTGIYDPDFDAVYLFGGEEYHGLSESALCLDLDSLTWQELTVTGDALPETASSASAWMESQGAALLFGGTTYYALEDDAWLVEPVGLCEVEVTALTLGSVEPSARLGATLSWVPDDERLILTGGLSYHTLLDTMVEAYP
jgi:hypothetical protein